LQTQGAVADEQDFAPRFLLEHRACALRPLQGEVDEHKPGEQDELRHEREHGAFGVGQHENEAQRKLHAKARGRDVNPRKAVHESAPLHGHGAAGHDEQRVREVDEEPAHPARGGELRHAGEEADVEHDDEQGRHGGGKGIDVFHGGFPMG
jgi:hypothetical protein